MSRTYGKAQDLIDFTRASSGTALRRVKYGAELVTNGTFDSDSDWTKGAGWSISGGVAVSSGSNNYGGLQQTASLTAGKVYSVTFTISSYTSGSLKFAIGSTTGNLYSSVGTFTENFVYIEPHVSGKNVSIFPWGAFVGTIDNVSVKEVIFDTSDGDLVLFNHPNNIPRIEYDADGNLLGLLVEESRTNLFVHSTVNSTWVPVNIVITENADTSPSGNVDATIVSDGSVNSAHYITQGTAISFTSGTAYTNTVIAKAGTLSYIQVTLPSGSFGSSQWANFDLVNGTITYETGGTAKISSLGDYYVCSFTATATSSTSGTGGFVLVDSPTALRVSAHQGNNSTISVYHCQIEAGSFPTSAIPTSGSTATRSADVASLSKGAFGYRQDAGTLYAEAKLLIKDLTYRAIVNLNTDGSNRIRLISSNAVDTIQAEITDGGVTQMSISQSITEGSSFKGVIAYKENDSSSSVNGSVESTDTACTIPAVTKLDIMTGNSGHIKSIKYIPRRLTNDQLVELTS